MVLIWNISSSQSHWNIPPGQITLHIAHCVLAEMKDAGSQHSVGFSINQDLGHMLEAPRPPAVHNGHSHRLTDAARDGDIEACLRAIRINAVQDDFTRAQ